MKFLIQKGLVPQQKIVAKKSHDDSGIKPLSNLP